MEYASKGVAGAGLGTGIAGLSLGVLNAMGGIGGLLGGVSRSGNDAYVTRYEQTLAMESAAKDAEIGLLKADKYTDQKITEVVTYFNNQIGQIQQQLTQQVAYNATSTATISCIQGQIAQLMGLTKLVVPNTSVCPGWGNVTITPATTTTTSPAA